MGSFFFYFFIVLFIVVCLFMMLLILIQKGRGGGLSSAFGGAGGNTAFGSKTGDVLTWATSIVFGVFLLLAIVLNLMANARQEQASDQAIEGINPPVPVSGEIPAGGDRPPVEPSSAPPAAPATQP